MFGMAAGTRVRMVSGTEVTVTSPAHVQATVNVRVVTIAGISAVTAKDRYRYKTAPPAPRIAPSVSSVSPASGSAVGGTTVTVNGAGFTGVKKVTFGGTAATNVTVSSAAKLTVTSPAHAPGTVDVQVTTAAGTSATTAADHYGYTIPPVTSLKTTPGTTKVKLSWTDLAFPGFAGVEIRRATGTTPPSGPTKGTLVTKTGPTATSYTNTGLKAATTYSYALFTYDTAGKYGPADTITVSSKPHFVDVSGTLAHNTTWSPTAATAYIINGTLDVPADVTLTVDAGTVVKDLGQSFTVAGTLDTDGTTASPVTFTSFNDNTIGGTTGTGHPKAGDWPGIQVTGAGTADVVDTAVNYASTGIDASTSGPVVVTGSSFAAPQDQAVYANAASVTVENNAVTAMSVTETGDPADCAYFAISPSLNFGLLGGNTATGAGNLCFAVSGNVVTSTMPAAALPWALATDAGSIGNLSASLAVPAQATLTIAAGAVIKTTDTNGIDDADLLVAGTLDTDGTTASPVTFTSFNDNTIGGTTGTGEPEPGDWPGITVDGGSANVQYADVKYAATALDFEANPTSNDDAHYDWFDENDTAIGASATWSTVTAGGLGCFYLPTTDVSSNEYGPGRSTSPLVSASDYAAIQAALLVPYAGQYPDGWVDDLAVGSSDYITWGITPEQCLKPVDRPGGVRA